MRAPVLMLLIAVVACSDHPVQPPELSGVHERIHDARQDFESGIEKILDGDDVAGENQLAASTTRLIIATRECAQTPGCDTRVFTDTLERLVVDRRREEVDANEADEPSAAPAVEEASAGLDWETPPTPVTTASLLTGADLETLIPVNRKVQAALNDWLTWHRPMLLDAWRNYQYMRPQVAPIYAEAGLPEALLFAIMAKESGAKVHAYSGAGAAGPLQFMGPTGRYYGLGSEDGFDMRLDPSASTRANTRYIKDLLRRFDGNLELSLAAYNVGGTRLRRIVRGKHHPAFWDPDVYYALPWETRNYVPKVLAAALLFLDPEKYGLRLDEIDAVSTTIALETGASLGELAVCLGQTDSADGWFRTLRNLNPRVSPGERLEAGDALVLPTPLVPAYSERCVDEAPLMQTARALHDADYPDEPEWMDYTVRPGDTLAAIAARHRSSLSELARINRIRGPDYVIRVGQRLRVPTRG